VRAAAEAVDWLAVCPARTGLFTDFDGTLSDIVLHPELARPLPSVPEVLKRLAARLGVVAVVSGRPAAWLVEQLALGGNAGSGRLEAYGLHGLEHTSGGAVELEPAAAAWEEVAAEARDEALAAHIAGLEVEDKRYGVTLHWRRASEPAVVREQAARLAERLAARTGLLIRPGKASVELVAPVGIDKGSVVRTRSRAGDIERMAFFGDDVSDLPAFAALEELAEAGAVAALKVAVAGSEAPEELVGRADLVLASPDEALRLLVSLADRLESGG